MNYVELKVGDQEYKLRLGAQQISQVEKKLGGNLLNVFMKIDKNEMPTLTDTLIILHGAMQKLNHGITMEKVFDIYDQFIEQGSTYMELIPVIIEVLKSSGFFKEAPQEGEKN